MTPTALRPDFTPSPQLYPFTSRWLANSAGAMHYVDEGAGPPILMCHGNPTWSFLYRNVITRLSDRFRCIAVDYPGFGLSDRPAGFGYTPDELAAVVGELVHALDLRDLIIMGHDWGGPVGLSVACAHPDRVSGLVLGGTWCWPPDRRASTFSRIMSSWPLQRAILKHNLFVERFVPQGTNRALTPDEMEHYRAVQPTPQMRVAVAELPRQIIRGRAFLQRLAEDVPRRLSGKRVLITFPMQDNAFPPEQVLPRLRRCFTEPRVVELQNAGHFFVEDAPDEVADAIAAHFTHRHALGGPYDSTSPPRSPAARINTAT